MRIEEWRRLPLQEREAWGLKNRGCLYASPAWEWTQCVHPRCRLARGEVHPIVILNGALTFEMREGYLRFLREDYSRRGDLAKLIKWFRAKARETGIYNPWEIPGGWMVLVCAALTE